MYKMRVLHFSLLFIFLIEVSYQQRDSEYCNIEDKSCAESKSFSEEKYLFYDVNQPEGFNLRRDVYMRFAIMLWQAQNNGKKLNWRLVLPPWHRLYHWKSQTSKSKPIPWSTLFDLDSLKSYIPVIELHEVFSKYPKSKKKKFEIDILFILQNFADPFEGGTFKDKWEIGDGDCKYDGKFWGYSNITVKETICVRFQGHISKLFELTALHPAAEKIMFAHGEIPLHDSYGTKSYWDCRKSMKFDNKLVNIAKNFMQNHLSCDIAKCVTYLSVHWRRGDFAQNRKDVPSLPGTVKQIDNFIRKTCPNISKIFVATDASTKEINHLEKDLMKLGYQVFFYMPSKSVLEEFKDAGIAIIDQIICSYAAYFIGTHESTFTFRIQEEREILEFDSDTTFNRLCPDKGKCERMSRWTIIN